MASKDRIRRRLKIPDELVALIRGCHPRLKRKIRAGLRNIIADPESGKSFKDELEGLKSYRVSRLRIIYRTSSKFIIDIVAVGPRKTIYEETYKIINRESNLLIRLYGYSITGREAIVFASKSHSGVYVQGWR